jgi:H+/Cl- antiporter ClcA
MAMKNLVHRVLNLLLYVAFCAMVGTGLLLAYHPPPGNRGGNGLTVLDMDRHEWGNVHLWISYIVIAAVIAHLGMNWTWLKKIATSMQPLRLWGGLLVGIVIIVALLLLPVNNRRFPRNQGHGRIHETQEEN